MDVAVKIIRKQTSTVYDLEIPDIDPATRVLLEDVRNELLSTTTVGMRKIIDANAIEGIRKKFVNDCGLLLEKKFLL